MAEPSKIFSFIVRIPQDLHAELELILLDGWRKRSAYGARNKVVNMLLREWVQDVKTKGAALVTEEETSGAN